MVSPWGWLLLFLASVITLSRAQAGKVLHSLVMLLVLISQVQMGYALYFPQADIYVPGFMLVEAMILVLTLLTGRWRPPREATIWLLFWTLVFFSAVRGVFQNPSSWTANVYRMFRLSMSFGIYLAVIRIRALDARERMTRLLVGATLVNSLYGLIEKYVLFPLGQGAHRIALTRFFGLSESYSVTTTLRAGEWVINGLTSEPGVFALTSSLGAAILLYSFLRGTRVFGHRVFDAIALAIIYYATLTSGAGTSLIVAASTLGALVLFHRDFPKNRVLLWVPMSILLLLFSASHLSYYVNRVVTLWNPSDVSRLRGILRPLESLGSLIVLGQGFDSVDIFATISLLIWSVGLFGAIAYAFAHISAIRRSLHSSACDRVRSCAFSLCENFILGTVAGGLFHVNLPATWVLLGLISGSVAGSTTTVCEGDVESAL